MRLTTYLPTLFAPLSLALTLHLTIPSSPQIPYPATLPPSTTASLTTLFASHTAPLRTDNAFSFRNVTPGSYLLDIRCPTHVFLPYRVDVHPSTEGKEETVEAWGTFRGNEWGNKGEVVGLTRDMETGGWEMEARVAGGKEYLQERSGCMFLIPI